MLDGFAAASDGCSGCQLRAIRGARGHLRRGFGAHLHMPASVDPCGTVQVHILPSPSSRPFLYNRRTEKCRGRARPRTPWPGQLRIRGKFAK